MEEPTETSPQVHQAAELTQLLADARQLLAEADAVLAGVRAKQQEADIAHAALAEAASAAQNRLADVTAAATAVLTAKTQVTDEQAVVATKSAHIQAAQEHADKVRVELDRSQTAAAQAATEAEGSKSRALTAYENAAEALASIRAQKAAADAELLNVVSARDQAKVASSVTKDLASRADAVDERIAAYEQALEKLQSDSKAQLETITRLLPGATAAGLAHAFDDRRKTFLKPATQWQWLFVGSVGALVLLALTGLYNVYDSDKLLPD